MVVSMGDVLLCDLGRSLCDFAAGHFGADGRMMARRLLVLLLQVLLLLHHKHLLVLQRLAKLRTLDSLLVARGLLLDLGAARVSIET